MQPSEIAESYDSLLINGWHQHLETDSIRQHEQAIRLRQDGGFALDVGSDCNGRFIRLLQNHGYEVEGLDVSTQMVVLAKTRQSRRDLLPRGRVRVDAIQTVRLHHRVGQHLACSPRSQRERRTQALRSFDARRCLHLDDRRGGPAKRKAGFLDGAAHVLQRSRPSRRPSKPDLATVLALPHFVWNRGW